MGKARAAAEQLVFENRQKVRFHSLCAEFGIHDLSAAYAVQDEFVKILQSEGEVPVGYKIGLTSGAMQEMTGIPHPISGVVHASMVHSSPATLHLADYGRLGLELEIAARFGKTIQPRSVPLSMSEIVDAVEAVCVSIEIIDDRNADYSTPLDLLTLVAENSWNHGIVTSEFISDWPDLAACTGRIYRNGVLESEGSGKDVLGHPLQPLIWLGEHLSRRSEPLTAGTVVTTGNFVRTVFAEAPCVFRFDISGVGSVTINVEN
ncbi:2-keto-4-pentenoate hydratase [Castellaniella sp.]|uniref:2-keto-4-pentenoate hydratase n=1 Tax=Castellaniella sp. TaxID=1955812 RepID=UPI00356840DD